jgi:Arc/MetJ family transcription regulator
MCRAKLDNMLYFLYIVCMRTTLNLNDELIGEAMQWTGVSTKTAVVNEALRQLIGHMKRLRLVEMAGKMQLDVNLDVTRKRR